MSADEIIGAAKAAGYELEGLRPTLEQIVEVLGPFSSVSDGTGEDEAAPKRRRSRRRG